VGRRSTDGPLCCLEETTMALYCTFPESERISIQTRDTQLVLHELRSGKKMGLVAWTCGVQTVLRPTSQPLGVKKFYMFVTKNARRTRSTSVRIRNPHTGQYLLLEISRLPRLCLKASGLFLFCCGPDFPFPTAELKLLIHCGNIG
jgi:hypothetical protein